MSYYGTRNNAFKTIIGRARAAPPGAVGGRNPLLARPIVFLGGNMHGDKAPNWKGGVRTQVFKKYGLKYIGIYKPNHPNCNSHKLVSKHVLIVESILGKYLPKGTVIHHVNNDGSDNVNSNLVVCQDGSYHQILHQRQIALRACGNASWRKCYRCKNYDALENLVVSSGGHYHRECNAKQSLESYHRRKAKNNLCV